MAFAKTSFKCSTDQLLEYRDLKKFIPAEILNNFTSVLERIPEWQFLIIFCYAELLFPMHSESDRTLISFRIIRYRISHSNQLFEYHDLTKVIATRLLTNYTSVLLRISGWQLPRNSEFHSEFKQLSFLSSHSLILLSFLSFK